MAHDPETNRINLAWLLRFRSVEILVQAGVIGLVVLGLRVSLPLMPLLGIVLFEVATNVAASAWLKEADRVPDGWLGTLLIADVLLFTGLLGFTGGPYNPFSFLYVIQVALGALVLSPWMAATVAILCAACFAALFEWHVWLPTNGQEVAPHELHHLQSHVQGMAFALAVASGLLVYFVQRVRSALAVRDAELARARDLAQRHERLAALATLSAGAAHELSTPLSTIALVAGELDRQLTAGQASAPVLADLALIRAQVDRCRSILVRLAARAGESAGEGAEPISIQALVQRAVAELPGTPAVSVDLNGHAAAILHVPPNVLAQALNGIVRNAQQASPSGAANLRIHSHAQTFAFEISDDGAGMPPAIAARAGEPFFTTKGPGEGMGLGLFLARTTAEQLGGKLEIVSQPGQGTRVSLVVPSGSI